MRIVRVDWQRYAVPFAAEFATAHGALPTRSGLLLQIMTDAGTVGWGEIAPLPGFGGTVDEALPVLLAAAPALLGLSMDAALARIDTWLAHAGLTATARIVCAGLDLACCDLAAQDAELSLAAWLAPGGHVSTVPVNAVIGAAALDAAADAARSLRAAGWQCVKLKVGTAPTLAAEVARVAAVRAALGPDAELRLDANGAWSRADALTILPQLLQHNIRLIEQPCAALDDLAAVRATKPGMLIAADELVVDAAALAAILDQAAADVIVVKPMAVGGVRAAQALIAQATAAGRAVIVTSMLDTAPGLAAALHLAATLPAPAWACGLATAPTLATVFAGDALLPVAGALAVPTAPGLGVAIDRADVARYTIASGSIK